MKNIKNENKLSDITLEIDLGAIKYNYFLLSEKARGAVAAAVVKANAYGLGVDKVAPVLYAAGCRNFFVATLEEALQLSNILAFDIKIYVFHGVKRGEETTFMNNGILPVINDEYQLDVWVSKAKEEGLQLPCILHFDTGMNRLGFNFTDAEKIATSEAIKFLDIKYIMSHLACINEEEHPLNKLQLERVAHIRQFFPDIPVSLANSRGIIAGKDYHFDMIRPGCSLYGVKASAKEIDLKPVITTRAKIIQIREVSEDGHVGYGATREVKKGQRLAVVPIGYADGYLRSLSNNSYAFYNGIMIPLVGRVSMDMCIFDVSKVPISQIRHGDEIELIGENFTVDDIADNANTIGYEILTNLGTRYKRIYKNY